MGCQLPGVVGGRRGDLRHQPGAVTTSPGQLKQERAPAPTASCPHAAIVESRPTSGRWSKGRRWRWRRHCLAAGAASSEASFSLFAQSLDKSWVEQALQATGTATIRRRKLPAEYVVWLVIGMAMLRDRSIAEVVRHLDLVMPTATGQRQQVSNGALVQARDRLGAEPLAWLFHATAAVWANASADEHRWRGLAPSASMGRRCACRTAKRTTPTSGAPEPAAARPLRLIRNCVWSR